ncbi:MAG: ABC transporter permease [Thermodesulfobacteriota bacterium]
MLRSYYFRLGFKNLDRMALFLLLPSLLFLIIFFLYPFFYGLILSFTPEKGKPIYDNFYVFLTDDWQRSTIWKTIRLAIPITILAILWSVPLAYTMRRGIRFERVVTTFLILPVSLGTVLIAEGVLGFLGGNGWFNQFLINIGLIEEPLRLTYNYIGVVIGLFLKNFPFCFLMLLGYVSGINPEIENSARILGASPRQVFWRVMLPLMAPGITIAFALVFVLDFAVFPTAILLGQPADATRTIAIAAYQMAFEHYDMPKASAIAMIMAVIQIIFLAIILAFRKRLYRGTSLGIAKG